MTGGSEIFFSLTSMRIGAIFVTDNEFKKDEDVQAGSSDLVGTARSVCGVLAFSTAYRDDDNINS
jgi:hypothetical protein